MPDMTTSPSTEHPAAFTVACDGACDLIKPDVRGGKYLPGPAGWAYVTQDGAWRAGSMLAATNQAAELAALLNALRDHLHLPHLRIESDSQYAIGTYTKWMEGARKRGWTNSQGEPTKNRPLIEALIEVRDARRARHHDPAEIVWVKGHSGHVLNEQADRLAVTAKRKARRGIADVFAGDTLPVGLFTAA